MRRKAAIPVVVLLALAAIGLSKRLTSPETGDS